MSLCPVDSSVAIQVGDAADAAECQRPGLAGVLAFVVLCSLPSGRLPGGAPVWAGRLAGVGGGSSPPAAMVSPPVFRTGIPGGGAAVALAHGGEAGVRMTALAAGTPVPGRPRFPHWQPVPDERVWSSRR